MRYYVDHFFIPARLHWDAWAEWFRSFDAEEPYYDVWG